MLLEYDDLRSTCLVRCSDVADDDCPRIDDGTVIHAFVLFCQVITLNVAINGYSSTLFALMVSNNFVELKGSVFKKFTQENLFQITCSGMCVLGDWLAICYRIACA